MSVTATLRPWRGRPLTRVFKLRAPEDAAGSYMVTVRAGAPGEGEDSSHTGPVSDRSHASLPQMLRELQSGERACEVVVELTSQDDAPGARSESPAEMRRRRMREGSLRIYRSDYVVDGSLQVPLTVVPPKTKR